MKRAARIAATFNRSSAARDQAVAAVAMPAVSSGSKGSGAPSIKLIGLLAISLIALCASAASASAAPPTVTTPVVSDISYASAHVEGNVSPNGIAFYNFEYSTDEVNWTRVGEEFQLVFADEPVNVNLAGLEGGTKYFVRLRAVNAINTAEEVFSAPPNPSFITLPVDPPTIIAADDASEVFSVAAKATGKVKRPANPDPAFDVTAFYPANPDPAFAGTACRFEYVTDAAFKTTGFASATPVPCEQPTITEPDAEKAVSAHLTGLQAETTYHIRLAAENASPTTATQEAANTFTTPTVPKPTVVTTDDASEIGPNSAKFSGKVERPAGDDPGLDTKCRFEYVTDALFTANEGDGEPGFTGAQSIDCEQNPIESAGETTVSAKPGLFPGTTYHFRLVAENAGGNDTKDAANTFTTLPAELPTVTIDPVASGTYTNAHVTGTVNIDDPGHSEAALWLEISGDGGATWNSTIGVVPPVPWHDSSGRLGEGSLSGSDDGLYFIEYDFTGLQSSTTYFFRLASTYSSLSLEEAEANGEIGRSPEPSPSITTEPLFPPTAADLAVSGVTATAAHFSATVDPHAPAGPLSELGKKAFATHWEFVCTPECKNANGNAIEGTVHGEAGAQTVTGDAKRLDPNTAYEVSLVVASEGGGETVAPVPFNTPLVKPTIKVAPGGPDGKGGYTLQGVVNPNGSPVTDCKFEWGPNSADYAFSADCSPPPGSGSKPVTVEASLTGLTPGAVYHFNLLATNGAGTEDSGDREFIPTLSPAETCPNQQQRKENGSLALPECRAYEMVTPTNKQGYGVSLTSLGENDAVRYTTVAANLVNSGQGSLINDYVATRTDAGWETIPNLNGSSGTIFGPPSNVVSTGPRPRAYSADLKSSLWNLHISTDIPGEHLYLRHPDGIFTRIGVGNGAPAASNTIFGWSEDLSHIFLAANPITAPFWGPGVYEFVGTGNEDPRRADVDNLGQVLSTCTYPTQGSPGSAHGEFSSGDGRVAVFMVAGGCGGANNPAAEELWARVNGTTSFAVSASQCIRIDCNQPSDPVFQGAAADGSRIFFTSRQQLLNADMDQSEDLYACDLPAGNPAPSERANHCSALVQVSGSAPGADVESVGTVSDNGATAMFVAKGVLAANESALGEEAVPGDHNLYAWRQDSAYPEGETTFVGRLLSADEVRNSDELLHRVTEATPDGRYVTLETASPLVATDTDNAVDVYRYDVETGGIVRASTATSGTGGNGESGAGNAGISDDGQKIAFTSAEPLSPTDGNDEPDVYLWTPTRVSLISAGAAKAGATAARIDASGKNIYFASAGVLTPTDGDQLTDVYDARIGGGFTFPQKPCNGRSCSPVLPDAPEARVLPSQQPSGSGNVTPSHRCPKGKVRKHGRCVKKAHKHHKKSRVKGNTGKSGGGK